MSRGVAGAKHAAGAVPHVVPDQISFRISLRDSPISLLDLAETSTPTVRSRIVLRIAVTDLLLAIVAAATQPHLPPVNRRLQSLARQMKDHPESGYPLPLLARTCGLSVNALITQFRTLTGDTPHAYLLRCRIECAKRLLPDHTCASVAHRLGFPSPQHFATQFKRLTGLTPREQAEDRSLTDDRTERRGRF